jgi:16S rRNA (guanine527-N7)-methyltransferase
MIPESSVIFCFRSVSARMGAPPVGERNLRTQLWTRCSRRRKSAIRNLQSGNLNMEPQRITELLAPFLGSGFGGQVLSDAQLHSISMYIDILLRWNARINLTSVRQPEDIVTRHLGEAFFAARHLFPGHDLRSDAEPGRGERRLYLIDVGSGAGFPGLPIKIWAPHIHLTLIEANRKKATFLREVIRHLSLDNADVFAGRLQDFARDSRGTVASQERMADIVTLRAVEHFDSILPAAANLVAPGGLLALLVGESQLERARRLAPHFVWAPPGKLPCSISRVLTIGRNESS